MITIVNFSHPIPANAPDVQRVIGADLYEVFEVSVQLDLNKPLPPQVPPLVGAAVIAAGGNIFDIDCVKLPGLADAAALIVLEFLRIGYLPHIIRFARDSEALPPRFLAVELLN